MAVPNIILPPTPAIPGAANPVAPDPTLPPGPPTFSQPAGKFTITDQLLAATTLRDNYSLALINDSLYPQPDYSLDGESVSRDAWRKNLMEQIKSLQEFITMLDPTEITTIQV